MSDTRAGPDHASRWPTAAVELRRFGPGCADPAAVAEFSAFYRAAAPKLVTFLSCQGASLTDAADCTQEALIEAFRKWSTLHHPYAWCRLVASRFYARRVVSAREQFVDDLDTAGGYPLVALNADLDDREYRQSVLALLDLLPQRQRQVMAWTSDGATPNEIADALQITPGAVRANLHKARAALRAHLQKAGRGASASNR